MPQFIEYTRLSVWYGHAIDASTEQFVDCQAVVSEAGLLIVLAGKEQHVYNRDAWLRIEGLPKEESA